jgi:hypothetical protein
VSRIYKCQFSRRGTIINPLTILRIPLFSSALPRFTQPPTYSFDIKDVSPQLLSRHELRLLLLEDESHIDPDAPIAGPSRSQDWYLNPAPEGYGEQSGYEGFTLLDASGNIVDPHAIYPDAFGCSEAGESLCC